MEEVLLRFEFFRHVVREAPDVLQTSMQDDEDLGGAGPARDVLQETLDNVAHGLSGRDLCHNGAAEYFHDD